MTRDTNRAMLANRLRENCLVCCGTKNGNQVVCSYRDCTMYKTKRQKYRGTEEELLQAARAYCLDCMGGMRSLVRKCENTMCAMYPIRDVAALTEG